MHKAWDVSIDPREVGRSIIGRRWGLEYRVSSSASLDRAIKNTTDVFDSGEVREERAQIRQLSVVGVVEPGRDGDSVVGVKDVRGGRVVNDDGRFHVSTELG